MQYQHASRVVVPSRLGGLLVCSCLALLCCVHQGRAEGDPYANPVAENIKDLNTNSARVRIVAALNLYNMGESASEAVPKLIKMLSTEADPDVRNAVILALGAAGVQSPEAVPPLIKVLEHDGSNDARRSAAVSLGRIGLQPELSVSALLAALKDKAREVRAAAAEALGNDAFAGSAKVIATALVAALSEEKELPSSESQALAKMGPRAMAALPKLKQLLVDAESPRKLLAARVLVSIGSDASAAAPECLVALGDQNPQVRVEAAVALLAFGQHVGPAMELLVNALLFDDHLSPGESLRNAVVPRAAWAVGAYARYSPSTAASKLAFLAGDRDEDVRRVAAKSLDQVLVSYVQRQRTDALVSLGESRAALQASSNLDLSSQAFAIGEAIAALEKGRPAARASRAEDHPIEQRKPGWMVAVLGAMALACFAGAAVLRRRSARGIAEHRSARVLLCYRREDSALICGRLYDYLLARFGPANVFRDIDSLAPGDLFAQKIHEYIADCDAVIVLIGVHWLSMVNEAGRRRLDEPGDFVRIEIVEAARQEKLILPVLHDGVHMPGVEDLPPEMATLAQRNATELTDRHFRSDIQLLVDAISRAAGGARDTGWRIPVIGTVNAGLWTLSLFLLGLLFAMGALWMGLLGLRS